MSSILWLASYPKSGNTWLRALLHNYLLDADQPAAINTLDHFFENESKPRWYAGLHSRPLSELNITDICRLRVAAQQRIADSRTGTVMVKTHNLLGSWEQSPLQNMAVTAGAVVVVRNPLDVVPSLARHFGTSIDDAITFLNTSDTGTATDEANVGSVLGSWSTHVQSWTGTPSPVIHVVRYEDLLDDAVNTLTGILTFLCIEPVADRVEKAIRFSAITELKRQEATSGFIEKSPAATAFFGEGRSGQWQKLLTDDQRDRVIAAHHEQMQRFDYLPRN